MPSKELVEHIASRQPQGRPPAGGDTDRSKRSTRRVPGPSQGAARTATARRRARVALSSHGQYDELLSQQAPAPDARRAPAPSTAERAPAPRAASRRSTPPGAASAAAGAPRRPEASSPSAEGHSLSEQPAPAPVHVLWDLDNKYPLVLDHAGLVERMRSRLRPFGRVASIDAFCNYNTLHYVPQLWEAAQEAGMKHPLLDDQPQELRCPLCGQRQRDEAALRKHFEQLHAREHRKRQGTQPAHARRYAKTEKAGRYGQAAREVLRRRRGYDLEGILGAAGVAVHAVQMGPQRADVALEAAAMELLRSVQVPTAAQGAEEGWDVPEAGGTFDPTEAEPALGGPVLALVSDDHGFEHLLRLFGRRGWGTVVVSNTGFQHAGERVAWSELFPTAVEAERARLRG
ncbi:hypothetical protein HYH03_000646 [Edaphochlamys debaryana]|uniref:C2H2-type domain-containing protein n=1 Tax=Edaphochlamys debaryana TaxID=47281 RepID=A0A835YQS2_9CHLO|nr:hypothetical protein HYH03_000646 [Edaphochlamys debaryana]|eukprot:KAG2502159.1 hypothetical protein HYH03_000646 [Edaphochlamys debaryana]